MRVDGTLYYVLKDHLGSASVVTNASGTTVGEDRFYPFGETRFTTGTMYTDKLFTGQREMRRPEPVEGAELGIYHYGARFYSPALGRFISADTIVPGAANPQNLNRFSYVLNNPVKYIDPSGHRPIIDNDENGNPIVDSDWRPVKKDDEDDDDRRCHTYHPCEVETNLYEIGWQNFGQAWSIYWNPNASFLQRTGSGYYMGVWGGAHIVGAVGSGILVREGIIIVAAELVTKNPNAVAVSFCSNSAYKRLGYTYFDAGNRGWPILKVLGIAQKVNDQFTLNQISKAKDFAVTVVGRMGQGTAREIQILQESGKYIEIAIEGFTQYFKYISGP